MMSLPPSSVHKPADHLVSQKKNYLISSDHGNRICISTKEIHFSFFFSTWQTNPAFDDTLIGFTGDINLVHGAPQVVKEESPVACSQVHLAGLPCFRGALLWPLVQQGAGCAFIFQSSILW